MKHCAVTDAIPGSRVWGIKDGLHLLSSEVSDKLGIGFLRRDRQNALDLFQSRWCAELHEAHERLDCCETNVSRTSAVSSGCFQMTEKVHDQRSIEMF